MPHEGHLLKHQPCWDILNRCTNRMCDWFAQRPGAASFGLNLVPMLNSMHRGGSCRLLLLPHFQKTMGSWQNRRKARCCSLALKSKDVEGNTLNLGSVQDYTVVAQPGGQAWLATSDVTEKSCFQSCDLPCHSLMYHTVWAGLEIKAVLPDHARSPIRIAKRQAVSWTQTGKIH